MAKSKEFNNTLDQYDKLLNKVKQSENNLSDKEQEETVKKKQTKTSTDPKNKKSNNSTEKKTKDIKELEEKLRQERLNSLKESRPTNIKMRPKVHDFIKRVVHYHEECKTQEDVIKLGLSLIFKEYNKGKPYPPIPKTNFDIFNPDDEDLDILDN